MRRLSGNLSYANVVATIALFFAVSGASAFAATQLAKNSVETKQLKKSAVTGAKVNEGKGSIADRQIHQAQQVGHGAERQSREHGRHRKLAPATRAYPHCRRRRGAALNQRKCRRTDAVGTFRPVGFYKDHDGVVHLEGVAHVGKGALTSAVSIFTLPPGFRPAPGTFLALEAGETGVLITGTEASYEGVSFIGSVLAKEGASLPLGGITFRAQG